MMKWIFPLIAGFTSFVVSSVIGFDLTTSLLYASAVALCARGSVSLYNRWLILSDRKAPETDPMERTLETNRAIFWKRAFYVIGLVIAYFVVMGVMFGLSPEQALTVLPTLLFAGLMQIAYVGALLMANFLLFFGPFLMFAMMGKQTYLPGDANWNVQISDVRGQKAAVQEMERILRLFEAGKAFVKAGGKREKGALMVGPPGVGKTLMAKAIASTLNMPIIIASGASFGGIFFGMDAVAVYMLMRNARKRAKRWGGAVVFIDEIDVLAARRAGMGGTAGLGGIGGMMAGGMNMGLNMLLTQMDGVDSPGFFKKLFRRFANVSLDGLFIPRSFGRIPPLAAPKYNLLFLGATNRPAVLDEAITRPGRFGRTIQFRMPTREARKDIAALYFDQKAHDSALDADHKRDEFARITEGHSPADIEQILSLALVYAFEDGRDKFEWKDVKDAIANIESGLAEAVDYTDRDKLGIARHELGHAIASKFYDPDKSMARLSVRMRGGSLGHFYAIDKEEEFVKLRSQLAGRLRMILGARASEHVFYGENSAGVSNDLMQATNLATRMIAEYGMGPEMGLTKEVNELALNIGEYLISLAEAVQAAAMGGTSTLSAVNKKAVAQVMGAAFIDSYRLIYQNKVAVDKLAKELMKAGELIGDEVDSLLDSGKLQAPEESVPLPPAYPELKLEKEKN